MEQSIREKIEAYVKNNNVCITSGMKDELFKILVVLYNRNSATHNFNANVVISADDIIESNFYGQMIVDILEELISSSWLDLHGDDIYDWEKGYLHYVDNGYAMSTILVRDYDNVDPEKLYSVYSQLENYQWSPAVILCTTNQVMKSLSEISDMDYRLYHYMCGSKFFVPTYSDEVVLLMAYEKLISDGWNITDDFKRSLGKYVKAIYSEASLQGKDFVHDLISRIYRVHYSKISVDNQLKKEDVPYSIKAEKFVEKDVSSVSAIEEATYEDDVFIEALPNSFTDVERQSNEMNVMVTNVSVVNPNNLNERKYKDELGNYFKGIMTNEAPIKSIAYRLCKEGRSLDKVIFIASDSVKKPTLKLDDNDEKMISSLDFLVARTKSFTRAEDITETTEITKLTDIANKTLISIPVTDEPKKNDVSNTVFNIYNILLMLAEECNRENKHINIFIESNGGVRYVLTMLLSLIKTVENFYDNVNIVEVTSMVTQPGTTNIVNTKDVYDTAQIMGIADEFLHYGRAFSMRKYFEQYKEELKQYSKPNESQIAWDDVNKLLNTFDSIADDIQLCRTAKFLEHFYGVGNIKGMIESFLDKWIVQDISDSGNEVINDEIPAALEIFIHLLELIENDFDKIIYKGIDQKIESASIIYLPKVIEWCLDKSFIQQALTLCSERLAEYLFETGMISLGDFFEDKLNRTDTKSYERFYYFIAHLSDYINYCGISKEVAIYKRLKQNGTIGDEEYKLLISDIDDGHSLEKCLLPTDDDISPITEFVNHFKSYSFNDDNSTKAFLDILSLFENQDMNKVYNINTEISKKFSKNPLYLTLQGKYIKDDGTIGPHPNMIDQKKILSKALSAIINWNYINANVSIWQTASNEYSNIVDSIFADNSDTFRNNVKNRYSDKQSRKFYIKELVDLGHITSYNSEKLQRILYVYSICKEQRNMSNHANVSAEDVNVAMNSEQLKLVINKLLSLCQNP